MKRIRNVILAGGCLLAAAALHSCTEDSYPGLKYETKDDVDAGNSESSDKVPVLMFTRDPFFINVGNGTRSARGTRSTGAFDQKEWYEADEWSKHKFYVYAFREKAEDNPPLNYAPKYDVLAKDDPDAANCLVDASVGVAGSVSGFPVTINMTDKGVEGLQVKDGEENGMAVYRPIYYSTKHQMTGYNFFMYRIDDDFDYNSHLRRDAGAGQVYYNLEIDGAMDPMCGMAPKLTKESVIDKLHYSKDNLSGEAYTEVGNILNYGYSTYSAHRGVHPVVALTHCLTRMRFTAYAGAATADNLVIDAVKIKSKYKGKFVVASLQGDDLGLTFTDEEKDLCLGERGDDGHMTQLKDFKVTYDPALDDGSKLAWLKQPAAKMGESILLPPSGTYEMKIEFTEMRDYGNGIVRPYKGSASYTLTPPKDFVHGYFKEGYVFDIKVAIFGSEKIQVFADVQGWQEADGSIDIEPDFEQ